MFVMSPGVSEESGSETTYLRQREPCRPLAEGTMPRGGRTSHHRDVTSAEEQVEQHLWKICRQVNIAV